MVPRVAFSGEAQVPKLEDVTEDQWKEYLKRLSLHAARFFVAYGWGTTGRWAGPGGITPGDVAAEAILKALDGTRRYDSAKCPNPMAFLRNVVRSLVNHCANSAGTRRSQPMPETRIGDTDDPVVWEPEGNEPDPIENCIRKETVDILKSLVTKEKDELLAGILECLEADISKPRQMAELLDTDVKTINNAQKRLWRRAEKILGKPQREGKQ